MHDVYLIDSSIYIFRYYFSGRPQHVSRQGREVSTVLAFTQWLMRFLRTQQPTHLACCFDESLSTGFRHQIDVTYKQNRSLPDDALAYELLACKQVASLLGIAVYASAEFEADDLLASLAEHARAQGMEPVLLTRDKDLGQILLPDSGMFWDYGYDDAIGYDSFVCEFGVAPERMAEYLAIVGDTADSIVGVRGVGKKTAMALFAELGSWDEIRRDFSAIENLPIRGAAGVEKKMAAGAQQVEHNLRLTALRLGSVNKEHCQLDKHSIDKRALIELFDEFNAPENIYVLLEKLC